nr:GLPGLI family protein [uncultured Chryseobacterium sp.]
MIKLISIILILFNAAISAQNYRVVYELNYKRDSLTENYDRQEMILDMSNKETKFYYSKLLMLDSLSKKGISLSVSFPLEQVLKRQRGSYINTNYYSVDEQYFQYNTTDTVKWIIDKDKKEIKNKILQKAKTTFGGRNWIAWFSGEDPIQEGPYKFSGLPGLIYEVFDTKNNFSYKLVSIKKQATGFDTKNIVETSLGVKPIIVSEKEFKKVLYNKYLNPFSEFENMDDGSFGFEYGDKHISTKRELLDLKASYQKNIRDKNNPVEIDKAPKYPKN